MVKMSTNPEDSRENTAKTGEHDDDGRRTLSLTRGFQAKSVLCMSL